MTASTVSRGQFTFYRSFFESIQTLPKSRQLQAFEAICRYALDGEEPDALSGSPAAIFLLVRPVLESGRVRAGQRKTDASLDEDTTPPSDNVPHKKEKEKEKKKENKNEGKKEGENKKEKKTEDEGELPAVCPPGDTLMPQSAPVSASEPSPVLPSEKKSFDPPSAVDRSTPLLAEPDGPLSERLRRAMTENLPPDLTDAEAREALDRGEEPFEVLSGTDGELGCAISSWLYARCRRAEPPTPEKRRDLAEQLLRLPREQRVSAVERAAAYARPDFRQSGE